MKTIYTYIEMAKNESNGWDVRNRFTRSIIGTITYSPFVNEYCYEPKIYYIGQEIVLSTTNLVDIITFIKKLTAIEKALIPDNS